MPHPYQDRLIAIRIMLKDPSPETVHEGYDLLFKLWRQYNDSPDFIKALMPIAGDHDNLVQELEKRLGEFVLKEALTDRFFQKSMDNLKIELKAGKKDERSTLPPPQLVSTKPVWWKNTGILLVIVIIALIGIIWWKSATILIVLVAIVIVGIINLIYIVPINEHPILADSIGLKLHYKAPVYISLRDENIIEVSIENFQSSTFKGTAALIFYGQDASVKPAPDQKLSATLEVNPLDKETKQFKFFLTHKPMTNNLNYSFKVFSQDGSLGISTNEHFLITPIPYLRTASKWLFGTLATLIVALIWDRVEEFLGFK